MENDDKYLKALELLQELYDNANVSSEYGGTYLVAAFGAGDYRKLEKFLYPNEEETSLYDEELLRKLEE